MDMKFVITSYNVEHMMGHNLSVNTSFLISLQSAQNATLAVEASHQVPMFKNNQSLQVKHYQISILYNNSQAF